MRSTGRSMIFSTIFGGVASRREIVERSPAMRATSPSSEEMRLICAGLSTSFSMTRSTGFSTIFSTILSTGRSTIFSTMRSTGRSTILSTTTGFLRPNIQLASQPKRPPNRHHHKIHPKLPIFPPQVSDRVTSTRVASKSSRDGLQY